VNPMPLGLVALIGIGAAVVAGLFTPWLSGHRKHSGIG
jgi:hypothetical protein